MVTVARNLSACFLFLSLVGCSAISPERMSKYLTVYTSADLAERAPVVFLFPDSGGSHGYRWVQWFRDMGISTVLIDSAGVRGTSDLLAVDYGSDLSSAYRAVLNNEALDLSRYAVMGLSKGGTAALTSTINLDSDIPTPNFAFALYPGANGACPNGHGAETEVHVFYGESDEWGLHRDTIGACKRMSSKSKHVHLHLFPGVHHGYDLTGHGEFQCCGGKWKYEANDPATEKTREIIEDAIKTKWKLL